MKKISPFFFNGPKFPRFLLSHPSESHCFHLAEGGNSLRRNSGKIPSRTSTHSYKVTFFSTSTASRLREFWRFRWEDVENWWKLVGVLVGFVQMLVDDFFWLSCSCSDIMFIFRGGTSHAPQQTSKANRARMGRNFIFVFILLLVCQGSWILQIASDNFKMLDQITDEINTINLWIVWYVWRVMCVAFKGARIT